MTSGEGKEMRTGKGSQAEEEYEEEEFGSKKQGISSNQTMSVNANSNNTNKGILDWIPLFTPDPSFHFLLY